MAAPERWQHRVMELGAFSVSLAVDDLDRSREFYALLGFEVVGGDADEGYLILANGTTILGLFHGMFDTNILTFNPGLTNDREESSSFTDVRDVQRALEAAGIELTERVDPDNESGPAHLTCTDPDGNPILIDQFF